MGEDRMPGVSGREQSFFASPPKTIGVLLAAIGAFAVSAFLTGVAGGLTTVFAGF